MEQAFSYRRKNPEYSIQGILTKRGFEEWREQGFQHGVNATTFTLLCSWRAESPAWGPTDVESFAKALKCLQSASRLDAPQDFMPSHISFSLQITSLLCAKWLNALLFFSRLNEEENGILGICIYVTLIYCFPEEIFHSLQWDHDFTVTENGIWGACQHQCRWTGNCTQSVSFEYRLKSIRKWKPLMIISKHLIRDESIATHYIFQGPLPLKVIVRTVYIGLLYFPKYCVSWRVEQPHRCTPGLLIV